MGFMVGDLGKALPETKSLAHGIGAEHTVTNHLSEVAAKNKKKIAQHNATLQTTDSKATSMGDTIFHKGSKTGSLQALRARNVEIPAEDFRAYREAVKQNSKLKLPQRINGAPSLDEVSIARKQYGHNGLHPDKHIPTKTNLQTFQIIRSMTKSGHSFGLFHDRKTAQGVMDSTTLKNIATIKKNGLGSGNQNYTMIYNNTIGTAYKAPWKMSQKEFKPLEEKYNQIEKTYGRSVADASIAYAPANTATIVRDGNTTITAFPVKHDRQQWLDLLLPG
jgi:hypothetical protein